MVHALLRPAGRLDRARLERACLDRARPARCQRRPAGRRNSRGGRSRRRLPSSRDASAARAAARPARTRVAVPDLRDECGLGRPYLRRMRHRFPLGCKRARSAPSRNGYRGAARGHAARGTAGARAGGRRPARRRRPADACTAVTHPSWARDPPVTGWPSPRYSPHAGTLGRGGCCAPAAVASSAATWSRGRSWRQCPTTPTRASSCRPAPRS